MAQPSQSPFAIFDIESIPDAQMGRAFLPEPEGGWASDAAVAQAMLDYQREKTKGASEFLRHTWQQVVAISVVYRSEKSLKVASLGTPESTEEELVTAFFEIIEKSQPILVDWNGGSFDLPVLQLRALKYGIPSFHYWNTGGEARWENYHDRYRGKHTDLMDFWGRFNVRSSLNDVATLCGFPGKLGMDGGKVWEAYREGRIGEIRDYCDHDVLNLYLVFLRAEMTRARISRETYAQETDLLASYLRDSGKPHFLEFLSAWKGVA